MKKIITTILIGALAIISQTSVAERLFDKRECELYKNEINFSLTANAEADASDNKHIKVKDDKYVYLGGQTVGVAFYTDGLFVTDTIAVENERSKYINTANDAGIKKGDYILTANGVELNDISNFDAVLKSSEGSNIKLKIRRENKIFDTEITPVKSKADGEYRLGLWLRDSAAGLGTVTYIDPDDNSFGALGHSICDSETGKTLKLKTGRIVECNITGIKKGSSGTAGELKGSFGTKAKQIGEITENSKFGLKGKMYSLNGMKLVKLGSKNSIEEGDAYIFSDFENGEIKKYSIKILHINDQTYPSEKSMIIQITDENLIEKTGGIVQGLSGSPIVQNDRLIGAVTHVMINDATKGYGIFIENMMT